jgi:hypothetical protein
MRLCAVSGPLTFCFLVGDSDICSGWAWYDLRVEFES